MFILYKILFSFVPPSTATSAQIRLHGIIERITTLCLCLPGLILVLLDMVGAWRHAGIGFYLLEWFCVARCVSAFLIFKGRASNYPLALAAGWGAPLSPLGVLAAIIALMVFTVPTYAGLYLYYFTIVHGQFLGLLELGPVMLVPILCFLGTARRLYRSLVSKTAGGLSWISPPHPSMPAVSGINADPFAVQGLIASSILIDQAILRGTDDGALVQANIDFVNWAMQDALLVTSEICPEATWLYSLDYYRAQVCNGGHSQFAFNSQMRSGTIDQIRHGLVLLQAGDFLSIFDEFLAFMAKETEISDMVRARTGMSGPFASLGQRALYDEPALKALDDRFFAADGEKWLLQHSAAWLRASKALTSLSGAAMIQKRQSIKAKNLLWNARKQKLQAMREAREAQDWTHVAAKRLCAASGLTFNGFTAGQAVGPAESIWGIKTSKGVLKMHLKADAAQLFDGKTMIAHIQMPSP